MAGPGSAEPNMGAACIVVARPPAGANIEPAAGIAEFSLAAGTNIEPGGGTVVSDLPAGTNIEPGGGTPVSGLLPGANTELAGATPVADSSNSFEVCWAAGNDGRGYLAGRTTARTSASMARNPCSIPRACILSTRASGNFPAACNSWICSSTSSARRHA